MDTQQLIHQLMQSGENPYALLDRIYTQMDKQQIRRTRNIRLIPGEQNRRGGKYSYAEWAHVIGIFQTLMYLNLANHTDNVILDVGCGTGLLGIASEPFLGGNGRYTGIDVMKQDIDFCRRHYPAANYSFLHLDTGNPAYAPGQGKKQLAWDIDSGTVDMLTALSVWTHLNEGDARFYIREVERVLKPGGKAIITFFLLDETYNQSLAKRSGEVGRYHMTPQNAWIFDQSAYGSDMWFCPQWAEVPEKAIGITRAGLDRLATASGLLVKRHYHGNWKEVPGMFFQDIVIFEKG